MQRWSSVLIASSLVGLVSCAKMQRDWEAQQAANQQAQADAQPVTHEQACKALQAAYCGRCNVAQQDCGAFYVSCIGTNNPADASQLNAGQMNQCAAETSQGDCTVMPRVFPASCYAQTPAAPAAPPSCPENAEWNGTQCTCVAGTSWDGQACVGAAAPSCPEGAQWDGQQCACAAGTGWNGQACVAMATSAPPPPHLPSCRALVIEKGYGPGATASCNGVEPLCAKAVLDANYGPGALESCRGVKGRCAVAVIQHNFGPGALENCRGVDSECAVAVLDKGYGPGALSSCKR